GAPIDGFGVGTHLDTSSDAPYLDCAYKLQEYAGKARRKRSEGKATWPGRKQVHRQSAADGTLAGDTIAVEGDASPGVPLLGPVMRAGKRLAPAEALADIRARCDGELGRLPAHLKRLANEPAYTVSIAPALRALAAAVDSATASEELKVKSIK
ncbi:MAG: nicotinate phosphoribosyltransferase, partial [Gammaproteobacteria bacterium]|nr:nicotinate phosphoribosyltransferase [Gammaproteobacteria bacterium]